MGLLYSITASGFRVYCGRLSSGLGAVTVAAVTGSKISGFCVAVTDALGATMASVQTQNVGAESLTESEGVSSHNNRYNIFGYRICFDIYRAESRNSLHERFQDGCNRKKARMFLLWNSGFYFALIFVNVWRNSIPGVGFLCLPVLQLL